MDNHPSECTQPTNEDIFFTKRLSQAIKLLDIRIFDQIILTVDYYYSFENEGII